MVPVAAGAHKEVSSMATIATASCRVMARLVMRACRERIEASLPYSWRTARMDPITPLRNAAARTCSSKLSSRLFTSTNMNCCSMVDMQLPAACSQPGIASSSC